MARNAGWYPDPNDEAGEVYWDGTKWHGARRRQPPPKVPSDSRPASVAPQSSQLNQWIPQKWIDTWNRWSTNIRAAVVGIVVLVLVLGVVLVVKATEESPEEVACRQQAEAHGFVGKDLDDAVDLCVKFVQK